MSDQPETQKLRVHMTVAVDVELNPDTVPDDEWRSMFYGHVKTLDDVAFMLADNYARNGVSLLNKLDGWADREEADGKVDTANVHVELDEVEHLDE